MAILESIKYQLLIKYKVNYIQYCDTDPMKWENRSGHKGLLDINTIKKMEETSKSKTQEYS
jgi:hypothetical protein